MKFDLKKRGVFMGMIELVYLATQAYKHDYFEIAEQLEIFTELFKE